MLSKVVKLRLILLDIGIIIEWYLAKFIDISHIESGYVINEKVYLWEAISSFILE